MKTPEFLLFASDAALLALAGAALLLVALFAFAGEQRRNRRRHIDAVGWMPWTRLFFAAFFCGTVLLAIGAVGLLRG